MTTASSSNQELFTGSKHAELYAKFRPNYPDEVFNKIIQYCRDKGGSFDLAVDIACGSGQSTVPLTKHFQKVIGVDVSEKQLIHAPRDIANLSFELSTAEDLGFLEDGSVDLVTVATAFHWFDQPKFFKEMTRVLKPGGKLVIYCYNLGELSHPGASKYLHYVYKDVLGPFWAAGIKMIEEKYRGVSLPYPGWKRDDSITLSMDLSIDEFVGYLGTWSASQAFQDAHPDRNLLEELKIKLQECLDEKGTKPVEESKLNFVLSVFMLMGTKPS